MKRLFKKYNMCRTRSGSACLLHGFGRERIRQTSYRRIRDNGKADQRNHGSGISIFEKYASLRRSLGAADMTADILMAPTRVGGDWWDGGQYMEQCMHSWKPNSLLCRKLPGIIVREA